MFTMIINGTIYVDELPTSQLIMENIIPKDLQIPLAIVVGLVGILIFITLSSISSSSASSSTKSKEITERAVQFDSKVSSPQKPSTPVAKKTGSIMTPNGRRSARIARKSRKEE